MNPDPNQAKEASEAAKEAASGPFWYCNRNEMAMRVQAAINQALASRDEELRQVREEIGSAVRDRSSALMRIKELARTIATQEAFLHRCADHMISGSNIAETPVPTEQEWRDILSNPTLADLLEISTTPQDMSDTDDPYARVFGLQSIPPVASKSMEERAREVAESLPLSVFREKHSVTVENATNIILAALQEQESAEVADHRQAVVDAMSLYNEKHDEAAQLRADLERAQAATAAKPRRGGALPIFCEHLDKDEQGYCLNCGAYVP